MSGSRYFFNVSKILGKKESLYLKNYTCKKYPQDLIPQHLNLAYSKEFADIC